MNFAVQGHSVATQQSVTIIRLEYSPAVQDDRGTGVGTIIACLSSQSQTEFLLLSIEESRNQQETDA